MLENSKCAKNFLLAMKLLGMLIMYINEIFKRTKEEQVESLPVCLES